MEWKTIESAPKMQALLLYADFGYVVGHYNTTLGGWVAGWDHRKLKNVTHWMPLREPVETQPTAQKEI